MVLLASCQLSRAIKSEKGARSWAATGNDDTPRRPSICRCNWTGQRPRRWVPEAGVIEVDRHHRVGIGGLDGVPVGLHLGDVIRRVQKEIVQRRGPRRHRVRCTIPTPPPGCGWSGRMRQRPRRNSCVSVKPLMQTTILAPPTLAHRAAKSLNCAPPLPGRSFTVLFRRSCSAGGNSGIQFVIGQPVRPLKGIAGRAARIAQPARRKGRGDLLEVGVVILHRVGRASRCRSRQSPG